MPQPEILQHIEIGDSEDTNLFRESVLRDFWICCVSREVSLLGRKEVLTGKAKFGILGDGKEVPQVALAKYCKPGDWRSGYYRDQTLMFALGLSTVEAYFAQLYADVKNDPFSAGRQMNAHFATPTVGREGEWLDHLKGFNVTADMSPTAGQMSRSLGIALASKMYRENPKLAKKGAFSSKGNEVSICTIGDASTSEGVFWETLNAAAVLQVPLAISVWDDGYGISVPRELQTTKGSISKAIAGFKSDGKLNGVDIYTCKAWDYPGLCAMYEEGMAKVRKTHTPALFHIQECTQPQGHSTSGSHERYKSKKRLEWEKEVDCIEAMAQWLVDSGIATEEEVEKLREEGTRFAREGKKNAWKQYSAPNVSLQTELKGFYSQLEQYAGQAAEFATLREELNGMIDPVRAEIVSNGRKLYYSLMHIAGTDIEPLHEWLGTQVNEGRNRYDDYLYSDSSKSALRIPVVSPEYAESPDSKPGYQVLNTFFDKMLERHPELVAFGEDVGKIGGVNQSFAGLQEKYGIERVFDTGIREWTIIGQAIGLAMRGWRPIAEIQYLDYLIYGITPLSDDLATLRYRSAGIQQAPAIIRTRGHRLEGIWHAGSPLGMILNALRGMYVCVPRNMVQAAGMYNTLLQSDDPALVIECLNSYRRREDMPENIGEFTVPLGVPEVLKEGTDLTIVSYGSVLHEIERAAEILKHLDISVEVIDVQTLLPFDLEGVISRSISRTSRVLFVDEDVPGGASAYMMYKVLQEQDAYRLLDSKPVCLTASEHRPPYGSDGDYFAKPSADDVVERVYQIMHEADPASYPVRLS